MSNYISQINNSITTSFQDNWWVEFDVEEIEDINTKFASFTEKVKQLRANIFQLFNSSILVGEFCQADDFSKSLDSITTSLGSIIQPLPPNTIAQAYLQETLNVNFIEAIKLAVRFYSNLHVRIKRRFEIDSRRFIHSSNPELEQVFEQNTFSDEVMKELYFFEANIKLTIYDIELRPHIEDYNELLVISYELLNEKKLGGDFFSILLKQKCDYLLAKWIFRKEHLDQVPIYSIVDNTEVELSINNFKPENPLISFWRKYIESHYEISTKWKSEVQRDFDLNKNISYEEANLKTLHRFIKYFKDVHPSLMHLNLIRLEIQKKFDKTRNEGNNHEKYAYSIALNYAINNEFSLLLATNGSSETAIKSLYDEIIIIQTKTTVQNFFPQYKYLEFLVAKLEYVYSQRKAIEFIFPARQIINDCEEIFAIYKTNVEWSKEYYNYAFQLPYDECNVEVRNTKLPHINIFSSFLLPLSEEKYIKEFEENQKRVYTLKSSIEIFENIEKEISEFNVLKKDVQQKEVKSMEIIAIFTAIITFVAVSIPSFKYINTPYQAALFMFALSSSLAIFILLLLTITRGRERWNANRNLIIGIILLAVLSWTALICFTKDPISPMTDFSKDKEKIENLVKEKKEDGKQIDNAKKDTSRQKTSFKDSSSK